jgi:hypothetical protein
MSSINFHLEEQDQEGRSCRYSAILVAGSYTAILYVITLNVRYLDNKSLDSMRNIDPSELELVEEIAQGGQAHVYLAKFKGWGDLEVVVKRYKGRAIDVVQLRRRLAKVVQHGVFAGVCCLFGYSEDNTIGEVSVVMECMRGDL